MRVRTAEAVCFCLCLTTPAFAQVPPNGGATQAVINSAVVSNAANVLHVSGGNLCGSPVVRLNGVPVTATNASPSGLDLSVAGVSPGTYLLSVSCGNGTVANAAFDVTIGAVGPQGPPGPKGDQGPKGDPGTTSAAPPQVVLDRNGVVVGTVVGTAAGASAMIRYSILGDIVILNATSAGLSSFGTAVRPTGGVNDAQVLFKESDCSGDAYVNLNFTDVARLLTARQAMTLGGLHFSTSAPPLNSCPQPAPGYWLYVTDPFACPVNNLGAFGSPAEPIGFKAFYSIFPGPNGNCAPLGNATEPGAFFMVYHRTDELSSKFTTPFYMPAN